MRCATSPPVHDSAAAIIGPVRPTRSALSRCSRLGASGAVSARFTLGSLTVPGTSRSDVGQGHEEDFSSGPHHPYWWASIPVRGIATGNSAMAEGYDPARIAFRWLTEEDLPLMHRWLNEGATLQW